MAKIDTVTFLDETPIVLVVDDDTLNVKLLADTLQPDYHVKFATSGEMAIQLSQTPPLPDIVLLDVIMPGMGGYETCKRLKQNPETQGIPVIFVTSCTEVNDKTFGFNLGAVDYVTKPVELPVLKARVRTHIQLKRQKELLETLSYTDPLTTLPNKRKYLEFLDIEWKRAARYGYPLSLLVADVDDFKAYNDHYGHGSGDECLTKVASVLKSSIKRSGDLVARIGGEEFAVILPDCDAEGANDFAQTLVAKMAEANLPHAYSRATNHVSISIGGVTEIPSLQQDPHTQFFNKADKALYQAKSHGRNQFCAYNDH